MQLLMSLLQSIVMGTFTFFPLFRWVRAALQITYKYDSIPSQWFLWMHISAVLFSEHGPFSVKDCSCLQQFLKKIHLTTGSL